MRSAYDGIYRFGDEGRILNAGRPHTAIGKRCAGAMMDADKGLPFEDILALRKVNLARREEAKCRRVRAAIVVLVVSILLASAVMIFW